MTDQNFTAAKAIKDEIAAIDSMLTDPVKPAFRMEADFPASTPSLQNLATPILTQANDNWADALTARRAQLVTDFTAVGGS